MNKSNKTNRRWNLRIFGGSSHPELTNLVARKSGVKPGNVVLEKFANNETRVLLEDTVREQNIFIIQTAGVGNPNDHIMELLLLVSTLRLASAERITVIMPLYFYANSDSKDCYRVSITGKLFANMLKRAGVDSVIILDAPTPQLEGFFDMNVDNLKIEPLFCHWIRKNVPNYKECVVMSPDEVGVKRVIMIADDLDVDYAVINSRRKHRIGLHELSKRHSRLDHQHLSDNWQIVETIIDDGSEFDDQNDDDSDNENEDNEDILGNLEDIVRHLPSEQDLQSRDVDSTQHYDPPECDAPTNYYKRSAHELSDNESLRLSSDYGTDRSTTPYERKISVERKEHKSSSGLNFKSSSQQQKDHLFATENEENEIAETRLSGDVEGKSVVIIHDVIDTGRQLKRAVEALKIARARCIYVLATHGVFSAEALAIIENLDPTFVKSINVTNSIPQTVSKAILKDRLGIIDVSALISEIIRRHHYCESVSVVGGEFKPIDFKADWVKIDENAKMDVFDNESVGELGVQRFVQRTDGNQIRSLNRPLERIRKGYRLSSKCWD